ncbi:MAG TPA: tetratricopeptide repeat protein, partial [Phycisphaerae bacterium]|nr:tetratricopeptide repeat protein [Phycisphaerae bacterium]
GCAPRIVRRSEDFVLRLRGLLTLFAGRWQIPAAFAAILALALGGNALRPRTIEVDFDSVLADLHVLREGKRYSDAADAIANLLQMHPTLPDERRGRLHELLSDVVYRQELLRSAPIRENVTLILEHADAAAKLHVEQSPAALLRVAEAYNWLRRTNEAIQAYRRVLERVPEGEERRSALRSLVRLLESLPSQEQQRRELLAELLSEEGISPAYLWWGVQNAMQQAFDSGDLGRAENVLLRYGEAFTRSDLKGYGDYLRAWLLINLDRHLEAEPLVREVDAWLARRVTVDAEMDRAGFLPALNRVLSGYVELAEHRPQAALDYFDQAIGLDARGDGFVAATIGRAAALAALERHEPAWRLVRAAAASFDPKSETALSGMPRLNRAMERIFQQRLALGDSASAVGYLALALELTAPSELASRQERHRTLAEINVRAAEGEQDREKALDYHAAAARHFEKASQLCPDDVEARSKLMWAAIQQCDESGHIADARRLLEQFVLLRGDDPRLPAALLQLGRSCEAEGAPDAAQRWYAELELRFPKLEEAARARLLRAQMLLRRGAAGVGEAEKLLLSLLEAENMSPEARVFREALYTLGDLLFEQGRFSLAIRRLDDYLRLYPDDPAGERVRFLLANAYRRSAYELRDNPPSDALPTRATEESRARFRTACDLFAAYLERVESSSASGNRLEGDHTSNRLEADTTRGADKDLYQRAGLLYLADCHYELNEPGTLQTALTLYRQAAARYQHESSALIAHVQIANIHLRQGQMIEAARAVENARWLLRSMPDAAFEAGPLSQSRAQWEQYLAAVAGSHLFRDVFADSR